ncbi:cAMP-specific 3',5'-cyclic phosphodiesterase 4D-like [Lagenorhynchus albirostris]|uniref:cAMP-specific 3',5'-cyclic phosphodiesterase 4D-like n=1 Tax=Lagenorhynchus albirostris TaxID=27610 RepID=UPI0028EFDDB0|nr:cAMP-specific 3',5'-cyclic phosphodiesterase 4D-like [Lagenorhynchus albirostris]
MKRNTCDLLSRSKSASEETLHSTNEEEDPLRGMEPYLVRRLSCRSVQLPPLAFRQLEQADLKSELENAQRPTSLPLKILPLIAITSADSSGCCLPEYCFSSQHKAVLFCISKYITIFETLCRWMLEKVWQQSKAKQNFAVTMVGGSGDIKQERHKTE